MAAVEKIKLPIVVFEKKSESENSTAKTAVIKEMLLDVSEINKMGIRNWDSKKDFGKKEDWCVLFDKLKEGESIIVGLTMEDLIKKFELLGIIKILS